MNERYVNLFLILFTFIGFIECLELAFWLMNIPSTFAFFGGITTFAIGFYICWQIMTNLLKSIFNKQTENK
jgi:hypothetical protein